MLNALRYVMERSIDQLGHILRRPLNLYSQLSVDHLKLYGERNTGTRFLNALLVANFRTPSLNGSLSAVGVKAERINTRDLLKEQRHLLKMVVEDKLLTLAHAEHIAKTFGWKHANPPVEYLASVPERAARTLFIVLVKHPVYWALSFHRRPYHTYFPATRGLCFHDFLHHIFIPSGRDNVDAALYQSAIELYATKVDGYRKLADLGVPFQLIRYEELIVDVSGTLDRLAAKYGLARREPEWVISVSSTKERSMSLADYHAKYRLDQVRDVLAREDYEFIIKTFGTRRLTWLGYVA